MRDMNSVGLAYARTLTGVRTPYHLPLRHDSPTRDCKLLILQILPFRGDYFGYPRKNVNETRLNAMVMVLA